MYIAIIPATNARENNELQNVNDNEDTDGANRKSMPTVQCFIRSTKVENYNDNKCISSVKYILYDIKEITYVVKFA